MVKIWDPLSDFGERVGVGPVPTRAREEKARRKAAEKAKRNALVAAGRQGIKEEKKQEANGNGNGE